MIRRNIREIALGCALSANAAVVIRPAGLEWPLWLAAGLYVAAGACLVYYCKVLGGPGLPWRMHRELNRRGYEWHRGGQAFSSAPGVYPHWLIKTGDKWHVTVIWYGYNDGEALVPGSDYLTPEFDCPLAAITYAKVDNWGRR